MTRTDATREPFIAAWHANNRHSIAALATELDVNPQTAQKWIKADAATATHDATQN